MRRNALSDFTRIKKNGKIAMKLEDGVRLIGVLPCRDDNDVLLATREGRAIRFPATAIRVFRSRDSQGVRGHSAGGRRRGGVDVDPGPGGELARSPWNRHLMNAMSICASRPACAVRRTPRTRTATRSNLIPRGLPNSPGSRNSC